MFSRAQHESEKLHCLSDLEENWQWYQEAILEPGDNKNTGMPVQWQPFTSQQTAEEAVMLLEMGI